MRERSDRDLAGSEAADLPAQEPVPPSPEGLKAIKQAEESKDLVDSLLDPILHLEVLRRRKANGKASDTDLEKLKRLADEIARRIYQTYAPELYRLMFDPPSVITESKKEGQSVQQAENNSSTSTEARLSAIRERAVELAHVADTVASLGLEGVDTLVRIAGLYEIGTRCEQLSRHLGMQAISEGQLSQAQLSRLLKVAPMTVNRWVKAAQEQEQQNQ